jgi:hypothetical protein
MPKGTAANACSESRDARRDVRVVRPGSLSLGIAKEGLDEPLFFSYRGKTDRLRSYAMESTPRECNSVG